MSESFIEKTSLGGGLKNAVSAVLIGIVLFIGSFPLLVWNEGRSIARYKTLKEGRGLVIQAPAEQARSENEGKLIHIAGQAKTADKLTDNIFTININAIHLKRKVEMYQWDEETKSLEGNKKEYSYHKKWSEKLISSAGFRKPGYDNPPNMPYQSSAQSAGNVNLGGFKLTSSFISQINAYESYQITNQDYTQLDPRLKQYFKPHGNQYFYGNPSNPQIGAMRITFSFVPQPTDVSVIGKQSGTTIETYYTKSGSLALLEAGNISPDEMFKKAENANKLMTWSLRFGGFLLMWGGLRSLFTPLSFLANYVPFLGGLFNGAVSLITALAALCLSLVTIAIAWIAFRPLLSLILFAVAAGAIYMMRQASKKEAPLPAEPASEAAG